MLDYYDHTQDAKFLRDTALPAAHEILTFFDQHYQTGADGKLVHAPLAGPGDLVGLRQPDAGAGRPARRHRPAAGAARER